MLRNRMKYYNLYQYLKCHYIYEHSATRIYLLHVYLQQLVMHWSTRLNYELLVASWNIAEPACRVVYRRRLFVQQVALL